MVDPEQLHDDGARLGRRRSLVVLAVALVVLVGLVVLRFDRSTPETTPAPSPTPAGVSTPSAQTWPDDLPRGTLVVAATGSVVTIDSGSAALSRTSVQADSVATSLTRLAGGVLVWRTGSRAGRALLVDGLSLSPLPGELRAATRFLPGPDGRVWATRGPRSGSTTWRLVDADGRRTRSVVVEGTTASDGAGGLLGVDERGFRPLFPRPERSRQPGAVIATGPDGYVVRSCASSECRFQIHRNSDGTDTTMSTAVGEDTGGGTLSPANQLLAVTETVGGTSTLRVSVVATGEVKEIFAAPKQSTSDAVWLDDRWLALISEDRLVLYDAADERVVTPDVPLGSVGPLAWVPA